ncbi:MAG: hypothetical protein IJ740_05880 [Ruminococcus sp.]|nr:hypothetical protein [Ruminococcus sp.]
MLKEITIVAIAATMLALTGCGNSADKDTSSANEATTTTTVESTTEVANENVDISSETEETTTVVESETEPAAENTTAETADEPTALNGRTIQEIDKFIADAANEDGDTDDQTIVDFFGITTEGEFKSYVLEMSENKPTVNETDWKKASMTNGPEFVNALQEEYPDINVNIYFYHPNESNPEALAIELRYNGNYFSTVHKAVFNEICENYLADYTKIREEESEPTSGIAFKGECGDIFVSHWNDWGGGITITFNPQIW